MEIQVHRSRNLLKAEVAIGQVLRFGVMFCAAVLALGTILRFLLSMALRTQNRQLIQELRSGRTIEGLHALYSVADFVKGVRALDPDTLTSLGLLCLIALPVVRVAMTVVVFLLERDFVYLVITLIVLGVLLFSLFYGVSL